MSKASEWAKKAQEPLRDGPLFLIAGEQVAGVHVTPETFSFSIRTCRLDSSDALALAHWIIDTFGEQP